MNVKEIRGKSVSDLEEILLNLHREQFNLKMQKATGQLAKPNELNRNRKTIARIHTVLTERVTG